MARLGDICKFQSGGTPSKSESTYFNGNIPWITTVSLNGSVIGKENAVDWITEKAIENSAAKIVPANSVMVGTRVGVGKVAINKVSMSTSQDVISLLDIDESKWSKEFICKFILGKGAYLNSQARGATIKGIKIETLAGLQLPDIPLEQQCKIATVTDAVDELISLRKQQLAKLDELVKARFVELFGEPENNPYKWPVAKLSEFCDLQNGYAFKSQDYLDNSSVLNCRMSNIRPDGGFDAEYHPKYLPDIFWEKYKEYRLVDGDVIIAMTDMANDPKILGVPTIVRTNGKRFLLNQRVGKLTFYGDKIINNVYLMFVLSQKHIRQQLVQSAGGSTQINVGKPAVLSVEFFVPPMELQNQFAAFVEQTDKSKLAIQQSLDKLETLKKSLMQKYFG